MFPFINIPFLPRPLSVYALLGILGIVVATYVAGFRAKRYDLTRSDTVYIAAFASVGLLIGSMILFAITQIPNMWANREMISTDFLGFVTQHFGGLVFYGGLFGAFIAVYMYAKRMKVPIQNILALTIPVFPLGHAIMRVGCYMAGCCFGMEHAPPFGIPAWLLGNPNGIRLPVQLYETVVNLIIFAVIWLFSKKERDWKSIACLYGLMYAVARFWLEFLRGDLARGIWGGLSTSQIISIAVIALCVFGLIYRKPAKPTEN
ncbi:MAG: prolipoprotein diacylglyceryl transferase [Oscillospiraceae bacterium]|nr:prolipoprotein diacylglyceryl transferase [Oscillospiraceae bacterium]